MNTNEAKTIIELYENYENATAVVHDKVSNGNQVEAFYICEIRDIIRKYNLWNSIFPHIKPYYAVKTNNSYMVVKVLNMLGINFDCASKNEIDLVLSTGAQPERIMYAHIMKPDAYLAHASNIGIKLFAFDNAEELHKIKRIAPNCQVLLRINVDDTKIIPKFGCNVTNDAYQLVKLAQELNINLVGVSFHVGSYCKNASMYEMGIKLSREVFDMAKTIGLNLSILNIGGAYSGTDEGMFKKFAVIINSALKINFGDLSIEIIAEPGSFFVDSAFTLACCVITKKYSENKWAYYINDGMFGSFNVRQRLQLPIKMHPLKKCRDNTLHSSIIFGATCSDIDILTADISIPALNIGDWLIFKNMGSYSLCTSSGFNGFSTPKVVNIIDLDNWAFLNKKDNINNTSNNLQCQKIEYNRENFGDINIKEHFSVTYCVDQLHQY